MRVFVTGGTGFIGRRTVFRLLAHGHDVTVLARRPENAANLRALGVRVAPGDVTRPDGLAGAMRGADALVHLANHYVLFERDEAVFDDVNVRGNRHVMEAALEAGVPKVVHVSSGVSYGDSPDQPLREESRVGPHPAAYWRTKHAGDEVVWALHRERGLPALVLYPGGVVGAGDPNETGKWIRRLSSRRQPLAAFPERGYTFVHVDDVAEAIALALGPRGRVGERYLIGEEFVSNRDFVALVAELAGVPGPPLTLPDPLVVPLGDLTSALARLARTPPPWSFSGELARHTRAGFRFGSDKARRELGLTYRPVRDAIAEDLASIGKLRSPVR